MTNKEKYKQAFSTLHASDKTFEEVEIMKKNAKTYLMKKTMAACAAMAIIFGSMTTAYATDFGGIREKLTLWIHGEETEVNVTDHGDGSFTYTYTDEDGQTQEGGAGGISLDDDGNETPLSAEEALSPLSEEVSVDEDGNIWLYCGNRKIYISDLFDEDNICRVAAPKDGETVYFTIHENYGGGYAFEMTNERPFNADQFTYRR